MNCFGLIRFDKHHWYLGEQNKNITSLFVKFRVKKNRIASQSNS